MRTAFTTFSDAFERSVRPLLTPFDEALQALRDVPDAELRAGVLGRFTESRDQLGLLFEKVKGQQTYVMIFGPLKSGKSTLMNALAGAYVSEVTSLPAYPTVVFVSHSESPTQRVTRFDGTCEDLESQDALHGLLEVAHADLASAVRDAELEGRRFEPMTDLPRAIKRIDVKLPAGELATSDTVLVDTPGLYTRMKFSYDAMTREFRHAASIAIFVVRSDNIFLEQVFEEFSELLDLFSKVFLVLNFDASRVDVDANGSLVPSIEQTEPERVVRAFEEFAMNARLKQAEKEGRLRIVPIDLLHAASARLKNATAGELSEEMERIEAELRMDGDEPEVDHAARFMEFRDELTDFVDSSDHLNRFVEDSLTRANVILDDMELATEHSSVQEFDQRIKDLVVERDLQRKRLTATRAADAFDWSAALSSERSAARTGSRKRTQQVSDALQVEVGRGIDDWFESHSSFEALIEEDLTPKFLDLRKGLRSQSIEDLQLRIDHGLKNLELPDEIAAAVTTLDIDLAAIGRLALDAVDRRGKSPSNAPCPLTPAAVPVRKRFLDWILFRSRDRVRDRLLGAVGSTSHNVAPAHKSRLLGETARMSMADAVDGFQADYIRDERKRLNKEVDQVFGNAFEKRLREVLATRQEQLVPSVDNLVQAVEDRRDIPERLENLRGAMRHTRVDLQAVRDANPPHIADVDEIRDMEVVPFAAELEESEDFSMDVAASDEDVTDEVRESGSTALGDTEF